MKKIKRALISVYNKSNIIDFAKILNQNNIEIISTGGTKTILESHQIPVNSVEQITEYPSILGGRVKTLHPKIFGGILNQSNKQSDNNDLEKFNIRSFDLILVDLYPFKETVANTQNHDEIIEKIDIGGVSLIRAAAKNYKDVLVIPSANNLGAISELLIEQNFSTSTENRLLFAQKSFSLTSEYELCISNYFNKQNNDNLKLPKLFNPTITQSKKLRYGENPHQEGIYYGDINMLFEQLNGKELSYNNLLDIDAAVNLVNEFEGIVFGILKHNNACGFSADNQLLTAWKKALSADPVSAFGGVLITNTTIDLETAKQINNLFFEILIAPSFSTESLKFLKTKKNRIILKKKNLILEEVSFRTILNGVLCQQKDYITDNTNIKVVSQLDVSENQMKDLIFASKICKHTKSNAIVLVKNEQLLGIGCGQTSRIDALKQAIAKAKNFRFSLKDAVMASDAFFPFPDCVKIANEEGIKAVIQPGGSKNDKLSLDYCNNHNMAMVFTGNRHFKH